MLSFFANPFSIPNDFQNVMIRSGRDRTGPDSSGEIEFKMLSQIVGNRWVPLRFSRSLLAFLLIFKMRGPGPDARRQFPDSSRAFSGRDRTRPGWAGQQRRYIDAMPPAVQGCPHREKTISGLLPGLFRTQVYMVAERISVHRSAW